MYDFGFQSVSHAVSVSNVSTHISVAILRVNYAVGGPIYLEVTVRVDMWSLVLCPMGRDLMVNRKSGGRNMKPYLTFYVLMIEAVRDIIVYFNGFLDYGGL